MGRIHTALRFSEWALEFMIVPPICFAFLVAAISLVWALIGPRAIGLRTAQTHFPLLLLKHKLLG